MKSNEMKKIIYIYKDLVFFINVSDFLIYLIQLALAHWMAIWLCGYTMSSATLNMFDIDLSKLAALQKPGED